MKTIFNDADDVPISSGIRYKHLTASIQDLLDEPFFTQVWSESQSVDNQEQLRADTCLRLQQQLLKFASDRGIDISHQARLCGRDERSFIESFRHANKYLVLYYGLKIGLRYDQLNQLLDIIEQPLNPDCLTDRIILYYLDHGVENLDLINSALSYFHQTQLPKNLYA